MACCIETAELARVRTMCLTKRTLRMNMTKKRKKNYLTDYLYILPAAAFVGIFFVSSILYTFYLSFFEWDGFSEKIFVGLNNYKNLFCDANFLISVRNTIIWVVCSLVTQVVLPLLFAILITRSSFLKFYKNIFYFPTALSATVGGMIMTTLLSTYGLPYLAGKWISPSLMRDWLSIPNVNTFIMIMTGIWQGIGLNMLLFISGLKNMDYTPVEASMIDGAGGLTLYTKVILPLLRPTIIVVLLMSLVNSFKVFDSIWVMTKGGPYRTSETLALTMYQESFIYNRLGSGAAIAIILTIVILIISYFNIKGTFKED